MRKCRRCFIIILVLFISIGFAVLTTNLGIISNLTFRENVFDVHFEKAEIASSSTSINNIVNIDDTTTLSISTTLTKPTDYIEFTFYVVNSGTIDAQLNSITTSLTTEQKKYIGYNFYYDKDDMEVNLNDYLYRGQARKIKAHFEYNYDIESLYSGETLSTTLTLKYIQPENVTTNAWNYDYSGSEQYFIAPKTGTYKLEVWGAQGGSVKYGGITYKGGYGGYSTGNIKLNKNDKIYINVGGQGEGAVALQQYPSGGYNGGGSVRYQNSETKNRFTAGGGGATHIALITGLLKDLVEYENQIIIVAGAGGGGYKHTERSDTYQGEGGSGGGYIGNDGEALAANNPADYYGLGGTQDAGGCAHTVGTYCGGFGYGGDVGSGLHGSAGGAGYYGGGACEGRSGTSNGSGGGGSGYIGYGTLSNKIMYCYNCKESTEEVDETQIKTRSTNDVSANAETNKAKIGNGYARITLVS